VSLFLFWLSLADANTISMMKPTMAMMLTTIMTMARILTQERFWQTFEGAFVILSREFAKGNQE